HSKNVAPDVMAAELWNWTDVQDHFDDLILRCRVHFDGEWHVAQEAACATLRSPRFWLDHAAFNRGFADGMVLFSGTINHVAGMMQGDAYEISMIDPKLDRAIRHTYRCVPAVVPAMLDARPA
nr:DUF2848 family protein [Pseudaminobacter sp.]